MGGWVERGQIKLAAFGQAKLNSPQREPKAWRRLPIIPHNYISSAVPDVEGKSRQIRAFRFPRDAEGEREPRWIAVQ